MKTTNQIEILERQELIDKLINSGQGKLVEALLTNENGCFTRKGRSNKSAICRVLGWKTKQLEDAFAECRRILGPENSLI